jgi:hypothetical protein
MIFCSSRCGYHYAIPCVFFVLTISYRIDIYCKSVKCMILYIHITYVNDVLLHKTKNHNIYSMFYVHVSNLVSFVIPEVLTHENWGLFSQDKDWLGFRYSMNVHVQGIRPKFGFWTSGICQWLKHSCILWRINVDAKTISWMGKQHLLWPMRVKTMIPW